MVYLIEYAGEKRIYHSEVNARAALQVLGNQAALTILTFND